MGYEGCVFLLTENLQTRDWRIFLFAQISPNPRPRALPPTPPIWHLRRPVRGPVVGRGTPGGGCRQAIAESTRQWPGWWSAPGCGRPHPAEAGSRGPGPWATRSAGMMLWCLHGRVSVDRDRYVSWFVLVGMRVGMLDVPGVWWCAYR